jgi:hypothetical protein
MSSADRDALTAFDHDLDALVAGTPADRASDQPSDRALNDLGTAARQFHGLAARADRSPDAATQRTLDTIWEDLMSAHAQASLQTPVATPRLAGNGSGSRTRPGRILAGPRPSRWQVALNGVLAAALILAIAAGSWRALDIFGPSDGGVPDPIRFSAMGSQGEENFTAAPVPTADECTVEPLTVEEVMTIFESPAVYTYEVGNQVVPMATPEVLPRELPPDPRGPYPRPEPAVVQEIAASQRMWLACAIAGDPFRVWAMESDLRIVQSIGSRYLGGYSREAIRAELEAVKQHGAKGSRFEQPTYTDDTLVPMVMVQSTDIYYLYNNDTMASAALYWATLDGSLAGRPNYMTPDQFNDPAYAPLRDRFLADNNTGTFIYSPERRRWVLQETGQTAG